METGTRASDDRDWLLTAGAASLVLLALSKRSTIGLAAMAGAGYAAYRYLPKGTLAGLLPDSLGPLHLRPQAAGAGQKIGGDWYPTDGADPVDESSMDSFPASDPAAKY